jgi:hypothetical protein
MRPRQPERIDDVPPVQGDVEHVVQQILARRPAAGLGAKTW